MSIKWETRHSLAGRTNLTPTHMHLLCLLSPTLATDEFHIPPASVGTVPELADWKRDHPYGSFAVSGSSSGSNGDSSSHASFDVSQGTLKDTSDGESSVEPHSSASQTGVPHQTFLFPVSNSPMDIVTMLMRLASFTGTILAVLIPKVKSNTFATTKVRRWVSGQICTSMKLKQVPTQSSLLQYLVCVFRVKGQSKLC